jgi:GDP-L-fucose synthase
MNNLEIRLPEDIRTALSGKRAVVTGGTGMIGREVVRLLLDNHCRVTSVSLDDLKLDERASYVSGDLSNLEFCLDQCNGIDYVFHVAGIKGSVVVTKERPASFFVPIVMMNTNILEAARRNNVKSLVYTSSIGAYPPAEVFKESEDDFSKPPMDMFPGWAKRMAELQIEAYRIQYGISTYSIVRPSNIYGPGDNFDDENAMVIPSLMAKVARGDNPVVIWGDGSSERDFLHATDAAVGVIYACIRGTKSKPVNLGCGYGITIRQLVETMRSIHGFEVYFDTERPAGFPKRVMDCTLAQKQIGFRSSVSLENGLRGTWDWFLENRVAHLRKLNYFVEVS